MSFASISKSIVNIFILTIEQMTMCNVKGVASIDVPTENYHPTAVPLSSMERFSIFQLIVLVLLSATLAFWFTLTIFISFVVGLL